MSDSLAVSSDSAVRPRLLRRIKRRCLRIVEARIYNVLMFFTTISCTLFLLIRPPPGAPQSRYTWLHKRMEQLEVVDMVFSVVFIADAMLNALGHGLFQYWGIDIFCKIDLCTAATSVLDLALRAFGFNYSLKSVRVFRVLKPMLRLKCLTGTRAIFISIVEGSTSLLAILFLTLLAILVFDVMGVEFYMGSTKRRCAWMDSQQLVVPHKACKRSVGSDVSSCGLLQTCVDSQNPFNGMLSFDNAMSSGITVFQVASGDNGYFVLHKMKEAEPNLANGTWAYFISINVVFSLILFTMFSAVLTP